MKKSIFENPGFIHAAHDYLYFLERGYPQGTILKITGDRYKLSNVERSALYRGISVRSEAQKRKERLTDPSLVKGNILHIDGFNIVLTIGSYLNGNLVFICNDSIIRDASEIHGKAFREHLINKALLLLFSYLHYLRPGIVNFYWDSPVSHSGQISHKVNELLAYYRFDGHSATFQSPDFQLKSVTEGILATSDTGIIDRCKQSIFDLSGHVLKYHYNKDLKDIRTLFLSDSH